MIGEMLNQALTRWGDTTCAEIGATQFSYADLRAAAGRVAAILGELDPSNGPVGLAADHSFLGYAVIVAALILGRPYVPLKPGLPSSRAETILRAAGCRVLFADPPLAAQLNPLCEGLGVSVVSDVETGHSAPPATATGDSNAIAYVMFTSGSTGQPKGVVLSAANIQAYCDAARQLFKLTPSDRCTQLFDLSFDLSVHDVLMTFLSGARLCVDRERQLIDPVGFAAAARATVWFSVPSIISMAKRFRRLKPNALPDVRLALFCGEALPRALALDWLEAAPAAQCFNVYGPTEATIAITHFRFERRALIEAVEPTVPIGVPYPGAECIVVDEHGEALESGEGELWLGGPQVALGYLNAADQTAERFIQRAFPGQLGRRWYRSGDLVERGDGGDLVFRGRIDQQVKINGNRVELPEVESVVSAVDGVDEACAFTFEGAGGSAAIGCAVVGPSDSTKIVAECRNKLPDYMVPTFVLPLRVIPLNVNGKKDRKALSLLAQEQISARRGKAG